MADGPTGTAAPPPPNERRAALLSQRNLILGGAAVVAVVILILGLRYHSGSERRRYDAILKLSLDRLVTAQEGFYYDSTHYAAGLRQLPTVTLAAGVHVQLFNPDRRSWWGIATHDRLPGRRCVVWVGTAPGVLPAEARAPEEETKPLCYDSGQLSRLPVVRASSGA
jgi:hypothetical protein